MMRNNCNWDFNIMDHNPKSESNSSLDEKIHGILLSRICYHWRNNHNLIWKRLKKKVDRVLHVFDYTASLLRLL